MEVVQILPENKRGMAQVRALLARTGITLDTHLDYTCGIFDDDDELIATASAFGRSLRCFAVSPEHQGEALLNGLLTHLTQMEAERGNTRLYVYTRPGCTSVFRHLGYHKIADVPGTLTFMENHAGGFESYLKKLSLTRKEGRSAAVVMHANPFTLGHRYLLERAAEESDAVHLFLLSEESGPIPKAIRHRLVREGVKDLPNVICHEAGDYIISKATFPCYFLKSEASVLGAEAQLDAEIFCKIAEALHITVRYLGEEPYCRTTGIYNGILSETLPARGIECRILERLAQDGTAVSASAVRRAIAEDRLEAVAGMLPAVTLAYFRSPEAAPVIRAIKAAEAG